MLSLSEMLLDCAYDDDVIKFNFVNEYPEKCDDEFYPSFNSKYSLERGSTTAAMRK